MRTFYIPFSKELIEFSVRGQNKRGKTEGSGGWNARQEATERMSRQEARNYQNRTVRGRKSATNIKDIHLDKHLQQEDSKHPKLHRLTVREVKVMHMPPKPLKVSAMKIRTERSKNNTDVSSFVLWGGGGGYGGVVWQTYQQACRLRRP